MSAERDLFGQVPAPAKAARFGRRVFLSSSARARAEEMRREGASLEAISNALGIAIDTVRRRLKAELERGLPGGRGAGRPKWSPTQADRAKVAALAATDHSLEVIAERLGVSVPTLRRHCRAELASGRDVRAGARRG